MAKTHKTIFGTTEKSNFILNMTNDQFNKLASVMFTIGFSLIFIMSAVTELVSSNGISEANHDWKIFPSISLGVAGILAVSVFIIALIKQTLSGKQIIASVTALLMAVFMYISYVNAISTIQDYNPFLGFRYGRYEGLMVHLSYLFIFLGSLSINTEKTACNIFRVFSVTMILQSIWSVLQFLPEFPNHYRKIAYLLVTPLLPSGTSGSPVFLATLLAAGLTVSAFGALHDKSKVFSAIHKISVLAAAFFLVKTQCLIGYVSSAVILAAVATESVKLKKSGHKDSTPLILTVTGLAAAYVLIFIKGFGIYDGEMIWQDGFTRLATFGQYSASAEGSFNIHSISKVYSFLWGKSYEIIKSFPLTGIGPDAFVFSQRKGMFNDVPFSVDRPYSEYLFYTASFGIPAAVTLAGIFFYSSANGIISAIRNKSWIFKVSAVTALLYTVTALITNSTATVTPYIWFLLGTCCCTFNENKTK